MSDLYIPSQIMQMTSEQVNRLCELWWRMFGPETRESYLMKVYSNALSVYNEVFKESMERMQICESEIVTLRDEAADIMRLLNKSTNLGEKPSDMPLEIWRSTLDERIQEMRTELKQRRAEICDLLLLQDQLCQELDESPMTLQTDPLPPQADVDDFRNYLERLRVERDRRAKEFAKLRDEIKRHMQLLELQPPAGGSEDLLLNYVHLKLTPDAFSALQKLRKCYSEQVEELHSRIDDTRAKIHVMWERLQETDEVIKRQVCEAIDYTQSTYNLLKKELDRCEARRPTNLEIYIRQLRVEIKHWWKKTLSSDEERNRFKELKSNSFNEHLMVMHEQELENLKAFYYKYEELFELLTRRTDLWTLMKTLDSKPGDPKRFNNRGGQLLKEERDRNTIRVMLPKVEHKIKELVHIYMEREHQPFFVYGEDILERIAKDWTLRRLAKEQQSLARKPYSHNTTLKDTSSMTSSTLCVRGAVLEGGTSMLQFPDSPLAKRGLSSFKSTTSLRHSPSERLQQKTSKSCKTLSSTSALSINIQRLEVPRICVEFSNDIDVNPACAETANGDHNDKYGKWEILAEMSPSRLILGRNGKQVDESEV
ncbi:protein regulator of cytokinesis 1-like [Scaptodrosophila lebanonensis]|uniref:Protein regulator of cytokinesis 1-like n=1 Tax=Drosophila lebanonensis TaxID=7225 RepID=A0A6J2TTI0_DROLE|nr:protein regulator of cytokinesis 1-like [Scaptodrosophila lebanonensis]